MLNRSFILIPLNKIHYCSGVQRVQMDILEHLGFYEPVRTHQGNTRHPHETGHQAL